MKNLTNSWCSHLRCWDGFTSLVPRYVSPPHNKSVRASRKLDVILQGASPCRVRFNPSPVSSVAPVAEFVDRKYFPAFIFFFFL